MIHVFIASPYGDSNDEATKTANVAKSMAAWHELAEAGFAPFCPLLSHFLHQHKQQARSMWLAQDICWLKKCDCLLKLSGHSPGADDEVAHARIQGIPVYFSTATLLEAYGV